MAEPVDDSADLTRTVVLKSGNTFVVSGTAGDLPIAGEHPYGLYRDDGRFLCGHELRIGGARPRLLVASAATDTQAVHELTNPDLQLPDGRRLPLQTLRVRLDRRLVDETTLLELVHVHLYAREPVELEIELALAADFLPMLALRGLTDDAARPVVLEPLVGGVRFSARGADGLIRATTVTAEPSPRSVAAGKLRFPVRIEPGQAADISLRFDLHQGPGDPEPPKPPRRGGADARHRGTEPPPGHIRVRTDDELFNRVLDRSVLDLRMLRSQLDGEAYYAAGIPWFAALFGRDSLITAIEMLAFDPSMGAQTLRVLARRLGRRVDPVHEEEPGKVVHELRQGELAATDATPLTRYYGTVDATPLFLCLLARHTDWTGTLDLFRELEREVDAALGWIDHYADHDGDGLLDYKAKTPGGLRNQGWKDSDDGVPDEHGAPLEPPVALVEAQAYAVRALLGMSSLYERAGDHGRAGVLAGSAGALQARLERFWLPARRFYSIGLDGHGRASQALASNQGHLLWAAVVEPARAAAVRDALMGEALFSGWGIRTLGRGEAGFNPVGYHLGTVWPHDTALCAAGLKAYGYDDDFVLLFEALLEVASYAEDYRLPELFAGFARAEFESPVPYPVACHPQAWAAAAIPYLLTTGLGLHPDALERSLRIRRPSLPRWVNRVEVEGLSVGGARVDLLFERAGADGRVAVTDARIRGELEVVLELALS
jgi:glycogen debranching enzyme